MPRVKNTLPGVTSRVKGQRSLDVPYLHRFPLQWSHPVWETTEFWRWTVQNIPVAMDCRETLISYITSLEWKLEPRESDDRDELKGEIEYHTELLEQGGRPDLVGWDFVKLIESVLQDYFDTPFGSGVETVREGDKEGGKIRYIIYMDSATLFPTLNEKYPIAQRIKEEPTTPVVFPKHSVNRVYISPRAEIKYEGWGMAPPEKIFLAMDQVRKGDIYLAKFLVDTPEAGLLDLIDMDQESATEWIEAFKDLYTGIDPFKIPVLYQHDQPAKWIPFGRSPHELMFNESYYQYVVLVCSAYGLTPTDIGFSSKGGGGGETLAGSIRDERRTRRSGVARTKNSLKYFFDRMLPKTLEFKWIDVDDEVSVSQSRARLAGATAYAQLIDSRVLSPKESRMQMIADGLITIAIPEDPPEEDFPDELEPQGNSERPGMLGRPIQPTEGGHGEISASKAFSTIAENYLNLENVKLRKITRAILPTITVETDTVFSNLDVDEYDWWVAWHDQVLWGDLRDEIPELTLSTLDSSVKSIEQIVRAEGWFDLKTQDVTRFVNDYVRIFRELREDYYVTQSKKDYEFGKSDAYVVSVEPDEELEKRFKSELRGIFRDFWKDVPNYFAKSVISGIRNSIITVGKLQILDRKSDIDDNNYIIPAIKKEISQLYGKLSMELDQRIMESIDKILEE